MADQELQDLQNYLLENFTDYDAELKKSGLSAPELAPFLLRVSRHVLSGEQHFFLTESLLSHWAVWALRRGRPATPIGMLTKRVVDALDYAKQAGFLRAEKDLVPGFGWCETLKLTPKGHEQIRTFGGDQAGATAAGGTKRKRTPKNESPSWLASALIAIRDSGGKSPMAQLAKEFGVSRSTISRNTTVRKAYQACIAPLRNS